jgi:hypothetical protein
MQLAVVVAQHLKANLIARRDFDYGLDVRVPPVVHFAVLLGSGTAIPQRDGMLNQNLISTDGPSAMGYICVVREPWQVKGQ